MKILIAIMIMSKTKMIKIYDGQWGCLPIARLPWLPASQPGAPLVLQQVSKSGEDGNDGDSGDGGLSGDDDQSGDGDGLATSVKVR